jgi:hypothetical protein
MRLKKVNQNISKLFCALFMLGMNVYGVQNQGYGHLSVPSNGNGQAHDQLNKLSQSAFVHSEGYFDTKYKEDEYFDSLLNKALSGSPDARLKIKDLTSQSDTQLTTKMWYDACNKVIHATMQGKSIGLHIFKHLTSDACYTKLETAGSDFLQLIMNGTAKIAQNEQNQTIKSPAHDRSFAILTYLTSQDCKVRPSQEAVDQLFREKAKQCVEMKHKRSEYSVLKKFETTLVEMKNESFEPTYVIKYLTGKHCGVPPSQEAVDSFFAQLIKEYTEMKSFGFYAPEDTRNNFFNAIIHLISNKCNRHPSPDMVQYSINALNQADSKRKDDIKSAILYLDKEYQNDRNDQDTKISILSQKNTFLLSLHDPHPMYLAALFEEYLKDPKNAVHDMLDTKLKNNNRDPQEQFTI